MHESGTVLQVVMRERDLLGGTSLLAMIRTTVEVLSSVSDSRFTIAEDAPVVAGTVKGNSGWSAGTATGAAPDS